MPHLRLLQVSLLSVCLAHLSNLYAAPIPLSGLIYEYTFDDTDFLQSGLLYNSAPASDDGNGSVTQGTPLDYGVPDSTGAGFALRATDQNYGRIPAGTSYYPATDSFTFSIDFRQDTFSSQYASTNSSGETSYFTPLLSMQGGDFRDGAVLGVNNLTQEIFWNVQAGAFTENTLTRASAPFPTTALRTWNNVTAVWDRENENSEIWFNGDLVAFADAKSISPIEPTWDMLIGAYQYSSARGGYSSPYRSGDALIDNVRIYDRVLTAQEIFALSPQTDPPPPIQSELSFGESLGNRLTWDIETSQGAGPGGMDFTGAADNVRVGESSGYLYMEINKSATTNRWEGVQLLDPKIDDQLVPIGYGTYTLTTATAPSSLDPRAVASAFVFPRDHEDSFLDLGVDTNEDGEIDKDSRLEIDIEITRWGEVAGDELHYTVHTLNPANWSSNPTYTYSDDLLNGQSTTYEFDWDEDEVAFRSYYGDAPIEENEIPGTSWRCNPSLPGNSCFGLEIPKVVKDGGWDPRLLLNFWLWRPKEADPTEYFANLQSQEMIFKQFSYKPRVSVVNNDFSAGTNAWTVGGDGTASVVDETMRLVAGSPVYIAQEIDLFAAAMAIGFDFEFLTPTGILEVWIDEILLGSLDASLWFGAGNSEASFDIDDSRLFGRVDAGLQFFLDGSSGSTVLIDNVSIDLLRYGTAPAPSSAALVSVVVFLLAWRKRAQRGRA